MHAVGHHLRTYAHHNDLPERDAFARSAFNRYYYGCFLLVRSTLIEINVPPRNIKHAKIKDILRCDIEKKLRNAKLQAQRNEDGALVKKIEGGLLAIQILQKLIEEARAVREVADYKPEIEVAFNGPDGFSLNGLDINSAHRWEDTVRTLLASLKSAWRDADGCLSFIEKLLTDKKIPLAGPVIQDHAEPDRFVAFIFASPRDDQKKGPSQLTLSAISAAAEQRGIHLGFVLIDKKSEEFDGSIKALLFTKFQNLIRNSFTVVNYKRASIWVEPKKRIDPKMIEEIRDFLNEFFALFDIDDVSVFFTQEENIPTPTVILRSLRMLAPCSVASLSRSLEEKSYKVPNEVWMAHALDRLRKAGSVVRKANGQFFLSLEGLRRLGTEKSRVSPDVKRALALGKKDS